MIFRRSQIEKEMEEELRSHIQHRADDLERSGLPRAEAERRARIEFGGHGRFKEECREALAGNFVETSFNDLRYSLRVLRKSPAFTNVAVVTLAVAIAANAVVFGILNALILHPRNAPRAESLYGIERASDKFAPESYLDYLDMRDRNRSFESLAAYALTPAGLDTGKDPSGVWGYLVTGNYFDALGVKPYLGRFFHGSDERGPNSAPYMVLPYAYWHSHFQDDRGVVGRVVRLNKQPFTVIGVTPPDFQGTLLFMSAAFFVPVVNKAQLDGEDILNDRGNPYLLMVLGHLKPGVTESQAISDLSSIGAYLGKTYPADHANLTFMLARPGLAGDLLGGPVKGFVTALLLLAGLILLAACANLGSLFAARATDRSREVALRLALGSSRNRILRGLFTEALIVSMTGGFLGIIVSVALLRGLSVWQPMPTIPLRIPVYPDANVYAVALVLALVSGILFAIVPVRQVLRTDPYEIVKSGSRTTSGRRVTMRDLLLVVQIAICAVLVTSSFVAVRGLERSMHGNFGFEPRNALLVNTVLTMAGYSGDAVPAMQHRMIDALQAVPGVQAVGLVSWPPLRGGWVQSHVFSDKTTDLRPANRAAEAFVYNISPGYFHAAETSLLAGRPFTWRDDKNSPHVAIVNPEFARKTLGSATNAVGRYFKMPDGTRVQVVGIAEQGKYLTLAEDPQPAMFLPCLQVSSPVTNLVVRSDRDQQQLAVDIRRTLLNLDAGMPLDVQTWTMDVALFAPQMATMSLGMLGVLGAMLSVTGIFGIAAYSVARRMKELGIRVALGAQRGELLQAALGRPLKLLAFGSIAGLALGILASRVLASIVYQATPRDPLVLAGVVFAMAFLGLLATWIPAQRALSVDPLKLLREE
jgi:predicted permease